MIYRTVSAFCVVVFMLISSLTVIRGQSIDSLLYLLNHNLVRNDSDKFILLCRIIENSADVKKDLNYCEQAVKLAEKLHLNPARPYYYLGYSFLYSGDPASALEYFIKAANYYKEYGSDKSLASIYVAMADVYNMQNNHHNAKYYLKNAIEIFRKEKDSAALVSALQNLGYINLGSGLYDTALIVFSTTGEIFQKLGDTDKYAYCLGNAGLAYSRLSDFGKAEDYLLRAIEILKKRDDEYPVTEFMIEYAGILQHKGEIKKAIACATQAFESAVKNGYKEYEGSAAYRLALLYKTSGKYDSAFYYQSLYINVNDSIKSGEYIIQKMADLRTEFEVAKAHAEVKLSEQKRFILRIVTFGLAVILLLAVGLIVLYYYNLKRSKMLTAELDERRILLEKQSKELLKQNDKIIKANEELKQLYEIANNQKEEIISSINYAQRIQTAVLPPETYITELINENFIFYKPKEIVSGDFYWIKQINQYIILTAADCTGHGVPGAFMSMLGISYLNEVVQRMEFPQANQILNELRKEIKHSLRQTGKKEESRDGIDMALCVIDTKNSVMQYSGANSPLYIISNTNGEPVFKEIKADMMPVGVHFSGDKSFNNHEIQLEIGDTFYIFTDGFIDQIGGRANTRFSSKKFKKLLLQIHSQPLFEQKEILEQILKDWMREQPQRDDILVIGARV
jgi:serine phosphatase RsbU (regulator of sigma subunit)/Tfp pilus assembly protein PilF